jgi:hypothetical protein
MGCLGATTLDRLFISADGATYKRQNAGVLFLLPITSRVRLPRQQRQRGPFLCIAHNEWKRGRLRQGQSKRAGLLAFISAALGTASATAPFLIG